MNGLMGYLLAGVMQLIAANSYEDGSGAAQVGRYNVGLQEARIQVVWCMPTGTCTLLQNPDGTVEYGGPEVRLSVVPAAYAGKAGYSPFESMGLTE